MCPRATTKRGPRVGEVNMARIRSGPCPNGHTFCFLPRCWLRGKKRRRFRRKGEVYRIDTRWGTVDAMLMQDVPIFYGPEHRCKKRCGWGGWCWHKKKYPHGSREISFTVKIIEGELGWMSNENRLFAARRVKGTLTRLRLGTMTFLRRKR